MAKTSPSLGARKGRLRRLGAVGLVTTLMTAGAAACGSSNASGSSKVLTLAVAPPTSNVAGWREFYADLAAAFDQQTGATLQIEYTITSESVETQMIDRAAIAGSGPDMIYMGTTVFPTAYYSKAFVTLTPADWKLAGGESQFYKGELGLSGPSESSNVGIPLYNVPHAMAYNTKLFKQAGITHPPTTWNEFISDAEKINDPSKGIYGTAMDPADTTDPWKTIWYFMRQLGGNYVSANDKTAEIDSPDVQKAVSFWFDWYTKYHIVNPNSLTWQSSNMEAAFAQGKVGEVVLQGPDDIPLYESGPVSKNFAFAPSPSIPYGLTSLPPGGSAPGTFLAGDGIAITQYAPLSLALEFAKINLSKKFQVLQYKLTGGLPVTPSAGAAVEAADPTLIKPFIQSVETQEPTPFVAAWGTIEAAMSSATSSLAADIASSGKLSSADIGSALAGANSSVQEQLP